jgi:hypothetical protein
MHPMPHGNSKCHAPSSLTNAASARLPANLSAKAPAASPRPPLAASAARATRERPSVALVIPCDTLAGRMSYIMPGSSDDDEV